MTICGDDIRLYSSRHVLLRTAARNSDSVFEKVLSLQADDGVVQGRSNKHNDSSHNKQICADILRQTSKNLVKRNVSRIQHNTVNDIRYKRSSLENTNVSIASNKVPTVPETKLHYKANLSVSKNTFQANARGFQNL